MAPTAEPATLEDVPALADIFFSGFNDDFFQPIFPQTPQGRAFVEESYSSFIRSEGPQKSQVFVARDESGKPVSSILFWFVRPGDKGLSPWSARWAEPKETMSYDKLEEFFSAMAEQHHQAMGDKEHIYLEVIATEESSRKKGYGTMLLEMGNKMADDIDYAIYLDSEKGATALYLKAGYDLMPEVAQKSPLAPLLRKKKSERA